MFNGFKKELKEEYEREKRDIIKRLNLTDEYQDIKIRSSDNNDIFLMNYSIENGFHWQIKLEKNRIKLKVCKGDDSDELYVNHKFIERNFKI